MTSSKDPIATIKTALDVMRRGGMVVLVDDADRENEGDLVIAAEHCRPDDINFMCKWGRGLVCLALSPARVDTLRLPMMVRTDQGHMGTAFTVSIEARTGVTTGISAADRARTVQVAVDEAAGPDDLCSPGHVFPLRAQPGGVLVRSGHTEGAVDLARLAGLRPAGVICEIMRDDGEMARMDDLEGFAATHDLPILSIADLIRYRLESETLLEELPPTSVAPAALGLPEAAGWSVRTFRSTVEPLVYYLAFCKGDLALHGPDDAVLLRAQRGQVLDDVFGIGGTGSGQRLRAAFRQIERAGRGVFLYVLGSPMGDAGRALKDRSAPTSGRGLKPAESGFRQFGLGAQVLRTIGLERIRVITDNPRKIVGVSGFGIDVVGSTPIEAD
ncbi:MAG: 3,4-dihydroxy-2-butanone-4-phosphate synthase [Deltaproteobacteria bacterium]|nr:3,4-dihydroxy-2-butanone-4-phosphate synthase [Deltaproteobacteria bacterium]